MRDTVAIIGSHPKTRADFDFSRDVDVWVFNEVLSGKQEWCKRADALFQMHVESIWRNPANRNDPHHFEWLTTQTEIPVYMQDTYSDIPMSIKYPLEEIVNRFGLRYFTSSVAYAIALACHRGYKRIEVYGVEMETNTEYQYQRDGVTLWAGVARGLGIETDLHMSILDQPLYGYEGEVAIPYERFEERIEELNPHINNLTEQYRAATINTKNALEALGRSSDKPTEENLFNVVQKQLDLGQELGELDGARQENMRYKGKADKMIAASEKFVFSRQEFETAASDLMKKHKEAETRFIASGTTMSHIHRNAMQAAKGSPKRKKLMEAYLREMNNYLQLNNMAAIYKGASKEDYEYMKYLDQHIRAAGGAKSEAVLLEQMQNA